MTSATIVHEDGSEVVEGFHFIEELTPYDWGSPTVRVWYSDPEVDDDDYTDYPGGSIVEVDPDGSDE